jgi:hypothetical protein
VMLCRTGAIEARVRVVYRAAGIAMTQRVNGTRTRQHSRAPGWLNVVDGLGPTPQAIEVDAAIRPAANPASAARTTRFSSAKLSGLSQFAELEAVCRTKLTVRA